MILISNQDRFINALKSYENKYLLDEDFVSDLRDASYDKTNRVYVYDSKHNLKVISMDSIAKNVFCKAKGVPKSETVYINSVDALLINNKFEWFFIEFKNSKISNSLKDNIEKKGMGNWLMLQDIIYDLGKNRVKEFFDYDNPCEFAREHIVYIVVCRGDKNPYSEEQVRNAERVGEHYTPEILKKLKYYFFKDAYVYTEKYFEHLFVKRFRE